MPKTQTNQTILQSSVQRVASAAEAVGGAVRRWPKAFVVGVALAGAAAVAGLVVWIGSWSGDEALSAIEATVGLRKSLPELKQEARENPKDADAHVALGDGYFEAKQRANALKAYDRALQLDPSAATERMVANLIACYGTDEQSAAHAIITQYKLVSAEAGLRELTKSSRWKVRTGAMSTLEKLGKARRDDYLTVWTRDLSSPDCDVRRHAVEKLGELGDKRALAAIRAARKKDQDETPWYAFSCLGGRADDAEKKILATR